MKSWQEEVRGLLNEAAIATSRAKNLASEDELRHHLEELLKMIEQVSTPD